MPKIYKKVDRIDEKFLHMSECNGQVDIGVVNQRGEGLGCLIGVHANNRVELVKHNSLENTGHILSYCGTVIPTVSLNDRTPLVKRYQTKIEIPYSGVYLDIQKAEHLAFALLNSCYEIRKDAQS